MRDDERAVRGPVISDVESSSAQSLKQQCENETNKKPSTRDDGKVRQKSPPNQQKGKRGEWEKPSGLTL